MWWGDQHLSTPRRSSVNHPTDGRRSFFVARIEDLWGAEDGRDVYVVGTGTSLEGFDWRRLDERRTIALNDAIRDMPQASYHLYHDDLSRRYIKLKRPQTTLVSAMPRNDRDYARSVSFREAWRLERLGPRDLWHHATVASTGVHLADRLGARRIFLLGIDGYRTARARYYDGRTRSNRKNYTVCDERADGTLMELHHRRWIEAMRALRAHFDRAGAYPGPWPAPGVYNLSRLSRIDAWEKVDPSLVFSG